MSDMLQLAAAGSRKRLIELSHEERMQLTAIIDLLIPSDKDFPPPSSLPLIDELLRHLLPNAEHKTTLLLSEKRLRTVLHDMNISADGNFCQASKDKQQLLLRHLEYRDPAFFQALWTFVNHIYYALMAKRLHSQVS
jgi:hypothetical protein